MNRLYVIKVGSLEIKGLISPSELPDLVTELYRMSAKIGATADYLGNGIFNIIKGDVLVTLTVGEYHESMPSRRALDCLGEIMNKYFNGLIIKRL